MPPYYFLFWEIPFRVGVCIYLPPVVPLHETRKFLCPCPVLPILVESLTVRGILYPRYPLVGQSFSFPFTLTPDLTQDPASRPFSSSDRMSTLITPFRTPAALAVPLTLAPFRTPVRLPYLSSIVSPLQIGPQVLTLTVLSTLPPPLYPF